MIFFLLVTMVLFAPSFVFSQEEDLLRNGTDRIRFLRTDGEVDSLTGTILNITGNEGLYFLEQGAKKPTVFSRDSILEIDTEKTESHREGDRAFAEGKETGDIRAYQRALLCYQKARQSEEKRLWVRSILTARLVETCTALGKEMEAIQEFLLLCRIDPQTPYLNSIPLCWVPGRSFKDPRQLEKEQLVLPWLDRKNATELKPSRAAVLLACSVLLEGSREYQAEAREWLEFLAASVEQEVENPHAASLGREISLLAAIQLWRLDDQVGANPKRLALKRAAVEKLSDPLRAGPYYLLAKELRGQGEKSESIKAFLRLPILYPENRFLVLDSLRQAEEVLREEGELDKADRIKRELNDKIGN